MRGICIKVSASLGCAAALLLCVLMPAPAHAQAADAYAQALAAFDAHKFSVAASLFARAETENPGQSDALLFEGKALSNLGQFSAAEQALRQYATRHPDSADALYMLGFVLNREDKPKESLEVYNHAARLSTPQSDDLKAVALDYVLLNDYPDAIKWMKQSVQFNPRNEQAWYGLGRCYYTQSSFPQARQAFARALALDPEDLKATANLALTLEMLNQPVNAEQEYKRAIALAASNATTDYWPYLDYGSFLLEQGRAAQAVPLLEKSVAIASGCAQCHGKLGRALDETGHSQQAVAELERAVALSPRDPKLHYALGHAYKSAGMVEKSRRELAISAKLYGTKDATRPK